MLQYFFIDIKKINVLFYAKFIKLPFYKVQVIYNKLLQLIKQINKDLFLMIH